MSTGTTSASVKGVLTGLAAEPLSSPPPAATDAVAATGNAVAGVAGTIGGSGDMISWGGYFQALGFLFLLVAALFILLWYLKRKGGLRMLTGQGDLVAENRMSLGPKKSLVVVRFLNRRLLLGVTDQQITLLTELPAHDDYTSDLPSRTAQSAEFSAHLDAAVGNRQEEPR